MAVKLFYPEPVAGVDIHPAFEYRHPPKHKGSGLFRDVQHAFFKSVETDDVASATAIVLVNNFNKVLSDATKEYIKRQADRAEELNKIIFVFSCGDFTDALKFDPRVWVFRFSLYRSSMSDRDISTPTSTEDPPEDLMFIRQKHTKPLVAFCGMGGFRTLRSWTLYFVKNFLLEIKTFFNPSLRAHKIGVYWRRAMMRACDRSSLIETNFIVRSSFSANAKSVEIDPTQARKEYLETTAHADFILAPKGDGNYSNRFLKTLAFGRIPVLIDTDVVLPFEDEIDYSKFIVRVPMNQVSDTPKLIREWYDALTPEEWEDRQQKARELFTTRLRTDSFFEHFFSKCLEKGTQGNY